jgi:nanoRNase/pAp phosphatase (c-di-AMP/oligoRNAs hydrolase)
MIVSRNTKQKLRKLRKVMEGMRTLLIVMQDNPDPDAIASAMALREIGNRSFGIRTTLSYGGRIGRAENRELVHYVGLRLHEFAEVKPANYDLVALVDTQPGTGNNPLPPDSLVDIVIDHHPMRDGTRQAAFTDVRSQYGATSTILWEYLCAADIVPNIPLATALLYGILSDTQDLGRKSGGSDIKAVEALYPLANKRMLGQIQRGRVPTEYYQMLGTALSNARLYGYCAISALGQVDNPDMIGEVADLLLRHEDVRWSMCYGFHGGKALISLRTQDPVRKAEDIICRIVDGLGTGGGHPTMAGGQIPLREDTDAASQQIHLDRTIRRRFLKALKVRGEKAKRLIHQPFID